MMSGWNHGADPIHSIQVNEHLDHFKKQLEENPDFLQEKLKQYFQVGVNNDCFHQK